MVKQSLVAFPVAPVAIIGTGPAALMAAFIVARQGFKVHLFEKKRGPGRKFLVAGSSGLNITYDAPLDSFHEYYRGPGDRFKAVLAAFPPEAWLKFIHDRGIGTFKGTSRRYFVEGLKASNLLRAWLNELGRLGVTTSYNHECIGFETTGHKVRVHFRGQPSIECKAACFALGGGSWEKSEAPLRWPRLFTEKGIRFIDFTPSNVGFEVEWPSEFLAAHEGQPLKNIALTTQRGTKRGDLVITKYGLEGTPIYTLGQTGIAAIDLKPEMTAAQVENKLRSLKENRSPLRRVKKLMNLSPEALALVDLFASKESFTELSVMARTLKALAIPLKGPRGLDEAISSSGGIAWEELDDSFMLKRFPGVFCAGEMLNWDAPTGGFLIQGCVSQGHYVGNRLLSYLKQ